MLLESANYSVNQMSPIITGDKRSPRPFGPSITRNLLTRVLTICHVKLTQSTALEQKRFDLRALSPALCNLWLSLVRYNHKLCAFFFSVAQWIPVFSSTTPLIQPKFDSVSKYSSSLVTMTMSLYTVEFTSVTSTTPTPAVQKDA